MWLEGEGADRLVSKVGIQCESPALPLVACEMEVIEVALVGCFEQHVRQCIYSVFSKCRLWLSLLPLLRYQVSLLWGRYCLAYRNTLLSELPQKRISSTQSHLREEQRLYTYIWQLGNL